MITILSNVMNEKSHFTSYARETLKLFHSFHLISTQFIDTSTLFERSKIMVFEIKIIFRLFLIKLFFTFKSFPQRERKQFLLENLPQGEWDEDVNNNNSSRRKRPHTPHSSFDPHLHHHHTAAVVYVALHPFFPFTHFFVFTIFSSTCRTIIHQLAVKSCYPSDSANA